MVSRSVRLKNIGGSLLSTLGLCLIAFPFLVDWGASLRTAAFAAAGICLCMAGWTIVLRVHREMRREQAERAAEARRVDVARLAWTGPGARPAGGEKSNLAPAGAEAPAPHRSATHRPRVK